jgi:hypothetical protein
MKSLFADLSPDSYLPVGKEKKELIIIILIYKDTPTEKQRMCNVITKVIPISVWANGTTSKSFSKYLSNIPVKHDINELMKKVILGTVHILWKVIM